MTRNDRFLILITAVLSVVAVGVTVANARHAAVRSSPRPSVPWDTVENWQQVAAHGHRMGAAHPKLTIVMFSDFQCGACANLAPRLKQLRATHGDSLAVVLRHFPLEGHPLAFDAARASECAAEQNRFEAFHDLLFSQIKTLASKTWRDYAVEAGVGDLRAFQACFDSDRPSRLVEADLSAGRELGVLATPTLLLNEELYVATPRQFESMVLARLGKRLPTTAR